MNLCKYFLFEYHWSCQGTCFSGICDEPIWRASGGQHCGDITRLGWGSIFWYEGRERRTRVSLVCGLLLPVCDGECRLQCRACSLPTPSWGYVPLHLSVFVYAGVWECTCIPNVYVISVWVLPFSAACVSERVPRDKTALRFRPFCFYILLFDHFFLPIFGGSREYFLGYPSPNFLC